MGPRDTQRDDLYLYPLRRVQGLQGAQVQPFSGLCSKATFVDAQEA